MPKPSLVVVVVEDSHHEMLVRRYLRRRGMEPHQMRFERSPSGEGSAERWVRARFAKEVSAYRNREARAATALIVVIDADVQAVQDRLMQLEQALEESGIKAIAKGERVARLVPKRNVETWILCLNGQAVDEATDYKETKDDWSERIPQASETLFRWTGSNATLPDHCIDSLKSGVNELKRLRSWNSVRDGTG